MIKDLIIASLFSHFSHATTPKPYLFFQHFKCVFYLNCLSKTVYFGKTAGAEWFGLCIPMMEFKHERDKTKQFTGGNKCYLLLLLRKQFTSTLNCWRCLFRLHSPFIHLTEPLSDRSLARSLFLNLSNLYHF